MRRREPVNQDPLLYYWDLRISTLPNLRFACQLVTSTQAQLRLGLVSAYVCSGLLTVSPEIVNF